MSKRLIKHIKIPKITDDCVLCFAQSKDTIPFVIKRIFYILNADSTKSRGFHAHHKTKQILFCLQGSILIKVDDGITKEEIVLDKPEVGVLLDKMVWHEMHNFQKNTVLLVVASEEYDPKDYIRDYIYFKKLIDEK